MNVLLEILPAVLYIDISLSDYTIVRKCSRRSSVACPLFAVGVSLAWNWRMAKLSLLHQTRIPGSLRSYPKLAKPNIFKIRGKCSHCFNPRMLRRTSSQVRKVK